MLGDTGDTLLRTVVALLKIRPRIRIAKHCRADRLILFIAFVACFPSTQFEMCTCQFPGGLLQKCWPCLSPFSFGVNITLGFLVPFPCPHRNVVCFRDNLGAGRRCECERSVNMVSSHCQGTLSHSELVLLQGM